MDSNVEKAVGSGLIDQLDSNTNSLIKQEESRLVKFCLIKYKCCLLIVILLCFVLQFIYFTLAKLGENDNLANILHALITRIEEKNKK